jgi:carbon storage regulator
MLNITRRRGERIVVGDNVFVTVMDVSGGTVRLGIDAPRSIRVYREEIWLEVKAQNEAAAQAASASMPDLPGGRIPEGPGPGPGSAPGAGHGSGHGSGPGSASGPGAGSAPASSGPGAVNVAKPAGENPPAAS